MAYDYSDDVAFAVEVVAEFGRVVTFIKKGAATVTAADALNPVLAAPVEVPAIPAAFVYPAGTLNLGLSAASAALFKASEQIAIVAATPLHDFALFDFIRDFDGSTWKINKGETLAPGNARVLHYIGVSRP